MTDKEIALKRVNRQIEMLTKNIEQYSNHSNGEMRIACITYREELKFYQALHDALTSPATSCKSCEGQDSLDDFRLQEIAVLKSQCERLVYALKVCLAELLLFKDMANCEHDVGICACPYFRAIENAEQALKEWEGK